MTYRFVKVPDCIDLTRDIMPLRGEDDNYIYGVDPAWLGEVLLTWCALTNYHVYDQQEMSEYPAVSAWHNFLRALCWNLKRQANMYSRLPSSYAGDSSDVTPISFGEVPEDVKVGDPLRRTDISDMFDWMKNTPPKYFRRYVTNFKSEIVGSSTTHGDEGNRSWEELAAPSDREVYKWNWFYLWVTGGSWENLNGGAWRKDERTMKCSGKVLNVDARWIKSCTLYVELYGQYGDNMPPAEPTQFSRFYPLNNCSFYQSGDDVVVEGYMDAATAKTLVGLQDVAYKTNLETITYPEGGTLTSGQGYSVITIYTGINASCFFEISDDYLVP